MIAIETKNLTKYYGQEQKPALQGLNITINSGEVYGYLGANGAGKSTTIKLLMGFLQPSDGTATINGYDTSRQPLDARRHIGYLAGDVALPLRPTGRHLLDYLSALQPAGAYRQVLEKRFEADLDKPIENLSKGNRQKIGIIQAFMHEPNVIILDEPTSGLDPLMQEAFYETVQESKRRGAAVLMSSHNLSEAARMCDRIGIIKQGVLIREQSLDNTSQLAAVLLRVTFASPTAMKDLANKKHIKLVGTENDHTATVSVVTTLPQALKDLSTLPVTDLHTLQNDLEDEFLGYYEAQS